MKKYFVVIIFAIITGSLLAYFTFKGTFAFASENKNAYIFQMGVYKSVDNANNMANSLKSSVIIKEGDYYHVYGSVFTDEYLIDRISNYYEKEKISFYIKNINISNELYNKITKYEDILKNSSDIDVIIKTSQTLLDLYSKYYEDTYE